ncbi:MAG: SIMPL domain-containing protein [Candidatus Moranbacteria bacterium]|nr:SIMPL domain-containing protein [Candidatus Moranbacteria bacterium]
MQENMVKMIKAAALVLIAVAAVMASYQYKLSVSGTYPTRTFSVDGTGEIDAVPDLATFSVTVTTDGGKNVTEVQTANTEKMNTVTAFLKEQGIDKKDLKTSQYNLSPRYSYVQCFAAGNCPAPTITGYNLTQTLEVKVRENDKLGDLLSGVVASGANSVSEVRFVVDDDTAAKDAAREEAIADAKKKAKATAKAAGFRLGKLVTLYENANPVMPYGMGGALDMAATKSEAVPVVEPGTQSTKVQVTLTYEVKD